MVGSPIIMNETFFYRSWFPLRSSNVATLVNTAKTPAFASFVETDFANSVTIQFFEKDAPATPSTQGILTVG